jgi:outer membrane receptor for ferrienterochelin and colicins
MSMVKSSLFAAAGFLILGAAAGPALAADAAVEANPETTVSEVQITAHRLDVALQAIEPSLGATSFSMGQQFINNLPGGANTQLNQVVLQAPGVTQDGFGQLHVRGDHGNIQFRLNNVILPEGLSVFGQTLSPRLASNIELITGALPAQYGLRTAGIINITTKSGLKSGGEVGIYGGSHGVITPSIEYGGSWGQNSGFVSASYTETDLGVESPDGRSTPLHDHSRQGQVFGYFDHIVDPTSRVSLILGSSEQEFEIPNVSGLHPDLGLTVRGQSDALSDRLDQRQREGTSYVIGTYLKTTEDFTGQVSLFARYSALTYRPDGVADLLFTGISQSARKRDAAAGLQAEGVYTLNDNHTLRGGVIVQVDRATSKTSSQVLALDAAGAQIGDIPLVLNDSSGRNAQTYSLFLQDEWKLGDTVTLNYGLRYDRLHAFRDEDQLSPRVNLVWQPTEGTTVHAGYARYFTPPPFELVASETVARFQGTTAEAPGTLNDNPYSERTHYYDLGVEQKLGSFSLGVDAYYKDIHNMLDEGQFGAPIILTPFNYRQGRVKGVEFTAGYARGAFSSYLNLAVSKAQGKDIVSSQFNFDPADLAYIASHFIYVDHDQTYTGSAGASYRWGATKLSGDLIYGSGLRKDGAVPNGGKLSAYTQVNLSVSHGFEDGALEGLTVRADLINAFDEKYLIRDGSGVGVGAPQYGPRRGVFLGLSKAF